MRTYRTLLLAIFVWLALALTGRAATPTYYSFDTNDFTVSPSLTAPASTGAIKLRGGAGGGTNIFNTIIVTNLYTTTNTYVINGDTNAAGLWINEVDGGIYNFRPAVFQNQLTATNIIGNERLTAAGALMLRALVGYNLASGFNDVSALTNSVIWLTGFDSDPANSSARLDSGNGQGQLLLIQNFADNSGFTMRNGEALFNSAPGSYQILQGDWVTATKGDTLMLYNNGTSWMEIGRMSGSTNNPASALWENVAGVLRPLGFSSGTNQFTIAEATGWSGTGTNAFLDDGTFGAIAVINPTNDFLPYRVNAYELGDSPLKRVDASTVAVTHNSTNSVELVGGNVGEIWFHAPVGSPAVVKSDTELYYDLEGAGTRFRMGNLLFTPLTTSQASLGAAATPWQWTYTDSVGWGGHTDSFDSAGGANPEGVIEADPGSIWRNTSAGTIWRKATGTGNTGWVELSGGGTINPTDNYLPFRTNSTTFLNSPFYVTGTDVALDSRLVFGPGTANVLYRSGAGLMWTNNSPALVAQDSTGSARAYLSYTNGAAHIGTTATAIYADNTIVSRDVQPAAGNTYRIGALQNSNGDYLYTYARTNMVRGFDNGSDYSIGSWSHGGTNGAVTYNSVATGVAGPPRNHRFDIGGTNQFAIGDGWVQLMRGMTKAEKATITATNGMVVYQTDNTPGLRAYVNGAWVMISTVADP